MTRLPRLHAGQSIARISLQILSYLGRCLASLEVRRAEESFEGSVAKPTIRQSAMGRLRLLTVGYPARIAISGIGRLVPSA
jgi:hypothetical protein